MPKILIIGAGIGGLTAAIALARTGHKVEVFEQAEALGDVGGGIQQSPNAMAVWQGLGLAQAVTAKSCEPEAGIFRDYRSGRALMTTKMRDIYEHRYGYKYLHIHRADLINILAKAAQHSGVTLRLGHHYEDAQSIHGRINLIANQQNFTGDVLIGADGIKSKTRDLIIEETHPVFTKQVAWRGVVETKNLPHDLIPFAANNWLGPKRHFVSYYVKNGEVVNFVAVEERDIWTNEGWYQKADKQELITAFSGWDPRITQLINACDDCYLWGLFDHPPLTQWSDGHITLLGDAAHPMLPFMAQGATMAIEDAWVLAHYLSKDLPIDKALKAYQNARLERTAFLQKISRDNARLYHQTHGFGRRLRNMKFKLGTHFPEAVFSRLDKIYGVDVTDQFPIAEIQFKNKK